VIVMPNLIRHPSSFVRRRQDGPRIKCGVTVFMDGEAQTTIVMPDLIRHPSSFLP